MASSRSDKSLTGSGENMTKVTRRRHVEGSSRRSPQPPARRSLNVPIVAIIFALVLAACGGGGADPVDEGDGAQAAGTEAPGVTAADQTPAADSAAGEADAGSVDEVLILLPNPNMLNYPEIWGAEIQGYFEEAGLEVSTELTTGGEALSQAMASNRGNVAYSGTTTVFDFAVAGEEPVLWYLANPKNPFNVYVSEDSDIQSAEDLAGRTIGVTGFQSPDYSMARALIEEAGLSEDDVEFTDVGEGGAAFPALERGSIEAYAGSPADAAIVRARGLEIRPLGAGDFLNRIGVGFWSMRDYVESNGDVLERLAGAFQRGFEWSQNNADEYRQYVAEISPESVSDESVANALIELVFEDHDALPELIGEEGHPLGYIPPEFMENYHDTMLATGQLEEPLDDLSMYFSNEFVGG